MHFNAASRKQTRLPTTNRAAETSEPPMGNNAIIMPTPQTPTRGVAMSDKAHQQTRMTESFGSGPVFIETRLAYFRTASIPSYIVNPDMTVLAASHPCYKDATFPFSVRGGKLVAVSEITHRLKSFGNTTESDRNQLAFPYHDPATYRDFLIHAVLEIYPEQQPLPRRILQIVVNERSTDPAHIERVLSSLYALTPSQTRIAALRSSGMTIRQIASHLKLSTETVRSHLKNVADKTGMRRQAQLSRITEWLSLLPVK